MQAELRFHYNDAADNYIPMFSAAARSSDVRVAPAGDAWEIQLAGGEPPVLHADDDYHAGAAGAYLNALVIYSTIYRRAADGLIPLRGVEDTVAAQLQASANAATGAVGHGPVYDVVPMLRDATVQVDRTCDPVHRWQAWHWLRHAHVARFHPQAPATFLCLPIGSSHNPSRQPPRRLARASMSRLTSRPRAGYVCANDRVVR